ncbi:MAG: hypothetical protein VX546_07435 [Myxococcota bacterium]|nr:hypothetical protein [Myxococcota bacterium]
MTADTGVGLPEALERAASALPDDADAIRPANGDPTQLLDLLGTDRAAAVLRWLLEAEPADAAELVTAWSEGADAGAAAVLAVAEDGLAKPARKLLRRAHHQLRSRGVAVPVATPEATVVTLPPVEEVAEEGWVTPLDPRGGRGAYLVASHPAGGLRMFEVVFDDARGIADCRVFNASRSRVRKFLKEFTRQGPRAPVAAEPDAVRALIARAAAAHPADRPLPRGFSEWRSALCPEETGSTPGELAREALGDAEEPSALRRVAERVRSGELGPWPPEQAFLEGLGERIQGIAEGGAIIVSPAQRSEQADQVLEDALTELRVGDYPLQTAARFEEAAYVLWKQDRNEEARDCLAAARAFREREPENPVSRSMLETVLAPALAAVERAGQGEEADVVTRHGRGGDST